MKAIYHLKPSELTYDFVDKLKQLHGNLTINIIIQDTEETQDETEFLLRHSDNRAKLLTGLNSQDWVEVDLATIEKNANSL
ncbi:hypothetical protein [Thioflexithrix psekupsensis]|uniref:Uncharacterized protein n=1 Tax=Thioflexithrix psekupsensis TaxID=1570016 RepID=A0A251XAM8_9GAMM|nr:hypothetical protein [Thioflexithrix psekupsensis]OUD14582.1 hypothetical protein TPSD3_09860 [Thioflexithrix psekupsensis]